jgi:hypothetical protein
MPEWVDRILYTRPTEDRVYVERFLVEGATCPACSGTDVRRYPIANHLGPRMTVTCQDCLHVLRVERPAPEDMWPPYRAVAYDWEPSLAERASRLLADAGSDHQVSGGAA